MSNMRRTRLVGMLVSLYLVGASAIVARQPLTYQERVKAQEAIERVYYTHRIWPKENREPKPPFEKMVAKAEIEAKVTDYLKKCEALDRLWQKPIQPEQLQAEMDRMVKGTRDPAMLKELFSALNDDPALIAECLARPLLADRLIHNRYFSDTRFHSDTREQAERALEEADPENLESWPQGEFRRAVYKLRDENLRDREWGTREGIDIQLDADAFAKMSADYPESAELRFSEEREGFLIAHVVSKSEKELVMEGLWLSKRPFDSWWSDTSPAIAAAEPPGGSDINRHPSVGADTPEAVHAAAWADNALAWPGVPDPRSGHTAVWTGSEMLVWGDNRKSTGAFDQPSSGIWTVTSLGANCPSAREHHTAIWTGAEMIVWGGDNNDINLPLNTGARYAPATDSWTATFTGNNCPSARYGHSALWTGSEMIVWGGFGKGYLITGGRYNPSSDTWTPTSTGAGCPAGRINDTAVWTGTEMIIWGGVWYDMGRGSVYENSGGRYNPSSDLWTPTSKAGPQARTSHTAVWTGTEMIVWGGFTDKMDYNSGGRYNPASDAWTSTSMGTNCPSARYQHTAVWTGTEMILWGGHFYDGSHHYYFDGGRYNPSSDTWRATSVAVDCPSARYQHTAVWTGAEMLVWGGGTYSNGSSEYFNTGGRYDPSLDAWTAIPSGTNCPSGRMFHTAIWTGTAMAVWGGITGAGVTQTGGSFVLNPIAPPVPAQIKKAAAPTPFTLIVTGTNLQNGISVRINGTPWTGVTWVSPTKIKIGQGKTLKALVPKGQTTQFTFANPDGGRVSYDWSW